MNRPMISAGSLRDASLPVDRLTEPELREMQRLLHAHEEAREQVAVVESRLSLLILTARDRRGIVGKVIVDPESGGIQPEGGADGR